jgi:cellobiose phosphorylase
MGSYKVKRLFRGATYEITVHNTGTKKPMTVDGKAVTGKTIPFVEGKKSYIVEVSV